MPPRVARERAAGVAAVVGGLLAVALTPPFAAAYFLAYPGTDAPPFWFDQAEALLGTLLRGDAEVVYAGYGRVYNVAYALFVPAAYVLHRMHRRSGARLERVGFGVVVAGLLLTFLGVAGDYWADGAGFTVELLGLLALAVGMSMYGLTLRGRDVVPRWCAWLFVLCIPGVVLSTLVVGHIPSGPTLPVAVSWLAVGAVLLLGPDRGGRGPRQDPEPLPSAADGDGAVR